jgi:hypothetical protein
LSTQVPYHTVGVDFVTLGEKKKVLTVTCAFTRHTSWVLAADETMKSAVEALQEVQLLRGGVRHIVVDQAAYFRSANFTEMASRLLHGATVELLASRAPFEGGFFEKVHDLGLRRLKLLLRDLDGHVNDLRDKDLQQCINQVTLILNTRPLGSYCKGPDGQPAPITPDSLAFGYTRDFGCLARSAEGPVLSPLKALAKVREVFLQDFWRALKQRSLNSAQYQAPNGVKLKINKPYAKGDAVLVYRPTVRKLQSSFRLAHVVEAVSDHRVKVVYPEGFEQLENVFNIVHVLLFPGCKDEGHRVGSKIRVRFKTPSGDKFFNGKVLVDQEPFLYVKYDDGDEHWIDTGAADFELISDRS